jgi:hypothetical protein
LFEFFFGIKRMNFFEHFLMWKLFIWISMFDEKGKQFTSKMLSATSGVNEGNNRNNSATFCFWVDSPALPYYSNRLDTASNSLRCLVVEGECTEHTHFSQQFSIRPTYHI